ncbi:MAG: hypothetical protein GWM98_17340, partial [Nitrospinaceae bacterium]|nr:hypothetical protein [Nitrospinaceae bacterium]
MKLLYLSITFTAFWVMALPPGALAADSQTQEPDRIPLETTLRDFGMEPADAKPPGIRFSRGTNQMTFQPGSRRLEFNGALIFLNAEISGTSNAWFVAKTDADTVLKPLLSPRVRPSGRPVLVIDPGHGGSDCGATSHLQTTEKVFALDIAQRIRRRFRASGIRVRFTRSGDRALTLQERAERARDLKGSAFVSIHLNSAPNKAASGFETFVLPAHGFPSTSGGTNGEKACDGNRYDAENTRLAHLVHKGLGSNIQAADR